MTLVRRAGIVGFVAALLCAMVPAVAGARVVRLANGHRVGMAFRHGVKPTSAAGLTVVTGASTATAIGNVDYNGGPVLHSVAPYLIFWDPNSEITSRSQTVLKQYLTDVAADSGKPTDVFAVLRQYTDQTGFAAASQTFAPAAQAIVDTQPYPTIASDCTTDATLYPNCITDAQLQAEILRLITADSLPTGTLRPGRPAPANAPIYFVITPQNVNICNGTADCATNNFCAYHGAFRAAGPRGNPDYLLYATVPFIQWATFPSKGCEFDGTATYQSPNNDHADSVLDALSHELSETITDPVLDGWYGAAEVGDNCASYGPDGPNSGQSLDAFGPTLGGDEAAGTLYDQLINGDQYYTQTEWSNGDANCQASPSADAALSADFTDSAPALSGTSVAFTPTSAPSTISSTRWDFGDFQTRFTTVAPVATSHTYTSPGTYTVTLTVVDSVGNVKTVTHPVVVGSAPTAVFTDSPNPVLVNRPVGFDGTGSSNANPGGSITAYSWNFGDGSSGTGATPQHTYTASGTYTATLTVTDSLGFTATTTDSVVVGSAPTAVFTDSPNPVLVNRPVGFDGTGSSNANPGGSITAYSWNFGDGSSGTGATPQHTYTASGTYTATLTVTDSLGFTATTTDSVVVGSAPTAVFTDSPNPVLVNRPVGFDGTGSSNANPGGSITAYSWNFGDGSSGTGATPQHTYTASGTYTATLTVTDSLGFTATTTHQMAVVQPDLAITDLASPSPVVSGHQLTYTIKATNTGTSTASGVMVSDPLLASLHFVSMSTTQGSCTRTTASIPKTQSGLVTCNVGTLGAGNSVTITIVVTATTPGTVTNTATVTATGVDPDADDSQTATTHVTGT